MSDHYAWLLSPSKNRAHAVGKYARYKYGSMPRQYVSLCGVYVSETTEIAAHNSARCKRCQKILEKS